MEAIYPHFSSSSNGSPRAIEDIIVRQTIGSAIAAHASTCADLPEDLRNVLLKLACSDSSALWDHSVGRLLARAPVPNSEDDVLKSVETALHAHFAGIPGSWAISFDRARRVRCGDALFSDVLTLQVSAVAGLVEITINPTSPTRTQARFCEGRMTNYEGSTPKIVEEKIEGHAISFTFDTDGNAELLPAYAEVGLFDGEVNRDSRQAVCEALDLLERASAPQYDWIAAVVRRIGFLAAPANQLSSSSNPTMFGTVALSAFSEAVPVAEMLVHEASHQHFFIAKRLGNIQDGSDCSLHYSPMAGKRRPLEPLLLAYHALGNMALMYHSLLGQGGSVGDYSARRLEEIMEQANELVPAFDGNSALTPLGRGIFEPLRTQLG